MGTTTTMLAAMPQWAYAAITILGMAVVTLVSRGFFLWSKRDLRMPLALQRALQVAPLAAIVAITAPEIFLAHGELIATWRDARLLSAVAATAVYAWRGGVLAPLLGGLAVYLPLKLGLGW
ncbi:MAG: AzlD domain-containing protein [Caldimonas sp.]